MPLMPSPDSSQGSVDPSHHSNNTNPSPQALSPPPETSSVHEIRLLFCKLLLEAFQPLFPAMNLHQAAIDIPPSSRNQTSTSQAETVAQIPCKLLLDFLLGGKPDAASPLLVEAKRAMSREEQHTTVRSTNTNIPRNAVGSGGGGGGSGNFRTKKIFVGGLPPTLTDMEFREYFEAFGTVTDVVVMYDQNTQRPRGFGFVSFDSEDSVERVVQKQFHDVGGKAVEVKRALPKDANPNSTTNRSMGGGSYQSYGGGPGAGSGGNVNSYDNRMDASRYMQTPGSGAGYNPYGSSGYGAPAAYGYGSAANPVGYGGHGGYGGNGSYGNPSGPGTGYISGPPGAPRSPWNTQGPSGYGSAGYSANTGYGGAGSWNTPGTGGPGSGHTGQSPGTAASYGNQGYGYGGYAGSEGLYGNQTGYGAIGGRGGGGGGAHAGNSTATAGEQGAVAGFISAGGGYSDGSGTAGYSNTWRSDAPQGGNYGAGQVNAPGGTIGYGGGYGASQSRQAQQQ